MFALAHDYHGDLTGLKDSHLRETENSGLRVSICAGFRGGIRYFFPLLYVLIHFLCICIYFNVFLHRQ